MILTHNVKDESRWNSAYSGADEGPISLRNGTIADPASKALDHAERRCFRKLWTAAADRFGDVVLQPRYRYAPSRDAFCLLLSIFSPAGKINKSCLQRQLDAGLAGVIRGCASCFTRFSIFCS